VNIINSHAGCPQYVDFLPEFVVVFVNLILSVLCTQFPEMGGKCSCDNKDVDSSF
jgi:hypothetical protein